MAEKKETPESLRAEIEHLRRLFDLVTDKRVLDEMKKMMDELERQARRLEQGSGDREA